MRRAFLWSTLFCLACTPPAPPWRSLSLDVFRPDLALVRAFVGKHDEPARDCTVRINGLAVPSHEYDGILQEGGPPYTKIPVATEGRYRWELDDPALGTSVYDVVADQVITPPPAQTVRLGDELSLTWSGTATPKVVQASSFGSESRACVDTEARVVGPNAAVLTVIRPGCSSSDPTWTPYGETDLFAEVSFEDTVGVWHSVHSASRLTYAP